MQKLNDLLCSLPGAQPPAFMWRTIRVKKKNRTIAEPNDAMRELHERLQRRLGPLMTDRLMESAYATPKGKSTVGNAVAHYHHRHFYQLDIRSAFPSVLLSRLAKALCFADGNLGTIGEVEYFLRTYCGGKTGGLATGAPTSPMLFDFYCAMEVDAALRKLCPSPVNEYTRYLDDITFSSDKPIPRILRHRIRTVVERAGFEVAHHKSTVTDRMLSPVTITGILVTRNGTLRPTDAHIERIVALLRKPLSEASTKDAQILSGYLGLLGQFKPEHAKLPWLSVAPEVAGLKGRVRGRLHKMLATGLLSPPNRRREAATARIPQQFVDMLRRKVPIQEVAEWYVQLKKRKVSKEYVGLSPFNKEKTPSFTVVPQKCMFFDFSSGIHGDIFELVMRKERFSFPATVRMIAKHYGIPMPQTEH